MTTNRDHENYKDDGRYLRFYNATKNGTYNVGSKYAKLLKREQKAAKKKLMKMEKKK